MIKGGIRDELYSIGAFNKMTPKHRTKVLSVDWERMVNEVHQDHLRGSKMYFERIMEPQIFETIHFCTGSSYSGKCNQLGMTDSGKYEFPYGCEYEGGFEDGMFHGEGTLTYPMGQKIDGVWENGRMVAYKFSHTDALDYNEKWDYCVMPDRRFNISKQDGLLPAGREHMTNQDPDRPVPPGMYDTGDGFYDPRTRRLVAAREPVYGRFIYPVCMVSEDRHKWIIEHCRNGFDEPACYRPDLYEVWTTGRANELEDLDISLSPKNSPRHSLAGAPDNVSTLEEVLRSDDYAGTGRKLLPRMFRGNEEKN